MISTEYQTQGGSEYRDTIPEEEEEFKFSLISISSSTSPYRQSVSILDYASKDYWDAIYSHKRKTLLCNDQEGGEVEEEAEEEEVRKGEKSYYDWYTSYFALKDVLLPLILDVETTKGKGEGEGEIEEKKTKDLTGVKAQMENGTKEKKEGDSSSFSSPSSSSSSSPSSSRSPSSLWILNVGCGNSRMSEELYDQEGLHNIINVDFSPTVIHNMRERNKTKRPGLQWLEADVTKLTSHTSSPSSSASSPTPVILSDSIDVVIDKGTMDALMCSTKWWSSVLGMSREIHKVLKSGGRWIIISFGEDRLDALCEDDWTADEEERGEGRGREGKAEAEGGAEVELDERCKKYLKKDWRYWSRRSVFVKSEGKEELEGEREGNVRRRMLKEFDKETGMGLGGSSNEEEEQQHLYLYLLVKR